MQTIIDNVFKQKEEIIKKTKMFQEFVVSDSKSGSIQLSDIEISDRFTEEYCKMTEYFEEFTEDEIMVIQAIMYFGNACFTGSSEEYKGNAEDVISYWLKELEFSLGTNIDKEREIAQMVDKSQVVGTYFEAGFAELEKRE